MAEETNPASSLVAAALSNAEMEPSQAGTEIKVVQAAIVEEHTSGQDEKGTVDKGAAEGRREFSRFAFGHVQQKLTSVTSAGTTINGDAAGSANGTTTDTGVTVPETEDTEMKDAEEPTGGPASKSAVPPTNGTPASSKKASNGSHKKKSAVPEHKSKKLNKKKSKPLTNLHAQPGEYYFARMKGHPPWPSIVCDEEMLPQSLIETRPVTTKQPDGTYKKPEYADGGKRAYERTFPIMFL